MNPDNGVELTMTVSREENGIHFQTIWWRGEEMNVFSFTVANDEFFGFDEDMRDRMIREAVSQSREFNR